MVVSATEPPLCSGSGARVTTSAGRLFPGEQEKCVAGLLQAAPVIVIREVTGTVVSGIRRGASEVPM